ncbi:phage tail tape measure protein [Erwinia sp. JH02]|uniref:phage tail tape measure protein n=1 Tax=Erwinia sp. JH02 TaxID=2733394 RepID=UPI001488E8E5|nr:phage tail tape measure protein [Erwinia sp. JH02]NNS05990.1 phage tail tape measure protein [Erwinia sp. JH02]
MKSLEFTLSLIDKITRPLKQAQGSVTSFADKSRVSFQRIAVGGAGLFGVGMAIKGALGPAIEMYDTLQEQSARGIDSSALKTIERDANTFAMTYGRSAVTFVQSTADINASIAGLTATELPKVTRTANIVAAALGGTATESAEFMGQMFANFQSYANQVGKVQFADELAGKMAYMKNTFGTDMAAIKDLMEGARGVGSNFGVGIDEQMAVMGQLRRTLGSEASGAYEGFMTAALEGGKKLGVSLSDSAGKMLSMPEMLIKLQGKYGKSIEGNLKAQAALDGAFGDSSAVVKQLWGNVDVLQRNITELGGSDGLKRTQEMAGKMVKPWDRFIEILTAIRRVIGLTLIPVLYPMLNRLADMGQTFARWMQMFPNIARVVGYAAMAILSFAAVGAGANVVMGVSGFIMRGLQGIWRLLVTVVRSYTAVLWVAQKAVLAFNFIMGALRGVLLAVRMAAITSGVAINFMSWPILLIIGAIALLVAGCYLLVRHWDQIKAAIMDTTSFQVLAAVVRAVAGVFVKAWAFITEGWNSFIALLANFSITKTLGNVASGIMNIFGNVWASVKRTAMSSLNWLIEKLNMIPGIDIDLIGGVPDPQPPVIDNTLSTGGNINGIEKGGINKTLSSNSKSMTDNSKRIDKVEIHTANGMTPGQLMEWQEMAG